MRLRACITLLLVVSACVTSAPSPRKPAVWDAKLVNLQRAAKLPWTDGGRCVVQEASQPWPVLVERCFHALDHDRLEFHDPTRRCAVASAGAAAVGIGVCVLAAPELVVGAVIVTGLATCMPWEVKTDDFDIHSPHSQRFFVRIELPEIQSEKRLAELCGYNFVVGVKSAAHKSALEKLDRNLNIEIMDWC